MRSTTCVPMTTGLLFVWVCLCSSMLRVPVASGAQGLKTKLVAKYYGIEKCKDKESLFHFANVSYVLHDDGGTLVNAILDFLVPISSFKTIVVNINRCAGGVASNLCEYYTRWTWSTAICSLLVTKNMIWTPWVECIKPTFKCPVPAIRRYCTNCSLDLRLADSMGLRFVDKYIWDTEIQLWSERNQLAFCMTMYFEPQRVPTHKSGSKS
ncbi:uncharacterized protein LOC127750282 isoform X2 [Frankliniella occidentalis]|nr:uncharacterized protein LOC127750282 isoform X2 [Frankliniella occidentalis]XP_052127475.1 uncharacterized protein LOC127750282 isoform X2 [Frankliniella occidentalis]XP_052127476.1 uncharacterized protein LOC127750282 isoform X2 [Frankliniella occidentalis]XP_052127477.1 uncharacterized protein LOC127750282 isoform X2 [Frankliniella occidentalis]XP_052127478.1 uncharacterized protein LOC127750282 isoform X2 [Frankliniella occidentalis]